MPVVSYFKKSLSGLESHTGKIEFISVSVAIHVGVFPLEDASPLQHYPQHKICFTQYSTHLYTGVERCTVRVDCVCH